MQEIICSVHMRQNDHVPSKSADQPAEKSQTKNKGVFHFLQPNISECEQTPPPRFAITNHKNESSNSLTPRQIQVPIPLHFRCKKLRIIPPAFQVRSSGAHVAKPPSE